MVIEKRYGIWGCNTKLCYVRYADDILIGIPKIKRMDRCGYLLRDKVRNLLLSVCKSLGIRIRWSRMEGNKQLLGKKKQRNTSQVLGLVLSLSDEGKVRAYIPITRWKDKLPFDKLKDKMGEEQRKDGWSPSKHFLARVSRAYRERTQANSVRSSHTTSNRALHEGNCSRIESLSN